MPNSHDGKFLGHHITAYLTMALESLRVIQGHSLCGVYPKIELELLSFRNESCEAGPVANICFAAQGPRTANFMN